MSMGGSFWDWSQCRSLKYCPNRCCCRKFLWESVDGRKLLGFGANVILRSIVEVLYTGVDRKELLGSGADVGL